MKDIRNMKVDLKEINNFTKELSILVKWEDLSEKYVNEFNKARSKYQIPGFRKGKVPRNIVKNNLQSSIDAHFIENSINEYYKKALIDLKLNPINQAKIDALDFKEGADFKFKAMFEVSPDIKIPDYKKKYKIKTTRHIVDEHDIEHSIKDLQEKHSTVKVIDSGASSGNFINGDFHELDEKENPIPIKKLENQYIKLGESAFTGDVEKSLLGAKVGDSINISINNKNAAIRYKVDVKRVEEQILPELNDKFAKSIDPSIKNLEDLRLKISENIQITLDQEHRKSSEESIVEYLIKKTKITAPTSMIENYLEYLIKDMESNEQNKLSKEEIRKNYREHANKAVCWHLIKSKIMNENNFEVTDEEVRKKVDGLKAQNPNQDKQIDSYYKEHSNINKLSDDVLNKKLFDHLIKYAINKVTDKSSKELRKGSK